MPASFAASIRLSSCGDLDGLAVDDDRERVLLRRRLRRRRRGRRRTAHAVTSAALGPTRQRLCSTWCRYSSRNFVDRRERRRDRRVREDADRHAVGHLVADASEQVDVLGPALAVLDARQDQVQPGRPLAAGRALAAGLVGEELRQVLRGVDDAGCLVHHDDRGRAEHRAALAATPSKSSGQSSISAAVSIGAEAPPGMTALSLRPPFMPPPQSSKISSLSVHAHRALVDAGPLDVAGDAVELGAGVLLVPADLANHSAPRLTMCGTQASVSTLLHDRRAAEDADDRGERRLDARLAALALEALDQAGLLAADVGAGAAVHGDVEVEAEPEDVLAEEALARRPRRCASLEDPRRRRRTRRGCRCSRAGT